MSIDKRNRLNKLLQERADAEKQMEDLVDRIIAEIEPIMKGMKYITLGNDPPEVDEVFERNRPEYDAIYTRIEEIDEQIKALS